MSASTTQPNHTEHALLVLLGQYAQHLGLIPALMAVPLHQKTYIYRPQAKPVFQGWWNPITSQAIFRHLA